MRGKRINTRLAVSYLHLLLHKFKTLSNNCNETLLKIVSVVWQSVALAFPECERLFKLFKLPVCAAEKLDSGEVRKVLAA